jgi:hypothetical protein
MNYDTPAFVNCFWLGAFERNGLSDSDFYTIWYDANKNTIECIESGSTRYYSGGVDLNQLHKNKLTPELTEKARLVLREVIFNHAKADNASMVRNPQLEHFTMHTKFEASEPIRKKGDDGKFYVIPTGTVVEVVGKPTAFGTFYRNGYNRPNPKNSTVSCRMNDGSYVYLPCHKLKLPESELLTDEVLMKVADAISYRGNWLLALDHGYDPTYMGWLSKGVKIELATAVSA